MENEVCENCGRAIGRLEQAFVHKDHVVCKECNSKVQHEPQEIQPSQAKSQQAPSAPNSHPSKTLYKKNRLARYKVRCGKRSLAFQYWLLGWTIFMICVICMLAMSTETPSVWDVNPYNPHEVTAWKSGQILGSFCCPLGLWFLFAVPLGIAAIATFGKDKK